MKKVILLFIICLTVLLGCQKTPQQEYRQSWCPTCQTVFVNTRTDTVKIFTDKGSSFDIMPKDTTTEPIDLFGYKYEAWIEPSEMIQTGTIEYHNVIK